jgi:Protein of unknown function (DUF4235)
MAKRSDKQNEVPFEPVPQQDSGKVGYKILATLGAAASTIIARKAVKATWKTATGKEPPSNPAQSDVTWGEAVTWAILSAAAVAVAKVMAQRRVAATWQRASGVSPPGFDAAEQ